MINRLMSHKILLACLVIFMSTTVVAQGCNELVIPSTPDSRFEVSGSEVKDLQTGLIWQRCGVGRYWDGITCSGISHDVEWPSALTFATGDWRVPNIKELMSIVEVACIYPTINSTVFPGSANYNYFSSSPGGQEFDADVVWVVNFGTGGASVSHKSNRGYVRLVRGG